MGPDAWDTVLTGGGVDLEDGLLVFDYAGDTSPADAVKAAMQASYHMGDWDIGQIQSSTAAENDLTLGWFDNTTDTAIGEKDPYSITIMQTWGGDFDLDGDVDLVDLGIWRQNFRTGTTWQEGDANYDGIVNWWDRWIWASNYSRSLFSGQSADAAAVPEPGTLAMLGAAVFAVFAFVGRRRKNTY
jgi:hypothetical protein